MLVRVRLTETLPPLEFDGRALTTDLVLTY